MGGVQGRRDAHQVPSSPASSPGPRPGLGRNQDEDSALAVRPRGWASSRSPRRGAHALQSPGDPGHRCRLWDPEVLKCPSAGGGARPGAPGPERPGRPRVDQALRDRCNGWGREVASGRAPLAVSFLFTVFSLPSLHSLTLVVLLLEDYGSTRLQVGAAAAPRVQRQLRGVAAGVQRARLPTAARAAPAGAQDAAGATGQGLQVTAGASPRREGDAWASTTRAGLGLIRPRHVLLGGRVVPSLARS